MALAVERVGMPLDHPIPVSVRARTPHSDILLWNPFPAWPWSSCTLFCRLHWFCLSRWNCWLWSRCFPKNRLVFQIRPALFINSGLDFILFHLQSSGFPCLHELLYHLYYGVDKSYPPLPGQKNLSMIPIDGADSMLLEGMSRCRSVAIQSKEGFLSWIYLAADRSTCGLVRPCCSPIGSSYSTPEFSSLSVLCILLRTVPDSSPVLARCDLLARMIHHHQWSAILGLGLIHLRSPSLLQSHPALFCRSRSFPHSFYMSALPRFHRHEHAWFHRLRYLFIRVDFYPLFLTQAWDLVAINFLSFRSPRMPVSLSSTPVLLCFEEQTIPPVTEKEASVSNSARRVLYSNARNYLACVFPLSQRVLSIFLSPLAGWHSQTVIHTVPPFLVSRF